MNRIPGLLLAAVLASASAPAAAQVDITATQNRYKQLYSQGKYAAALVEAQKLEAAVRARVGTQHANYATALGFVASCYQGLGKYAEAEAANKRVLSLRETLLGSNSNEVADTVNNLANAHLRQGRYGEAESEYQRALGIYEQTQGPGSAAVAFVLTNMGVTLKEQGKYREAADSLKRALAIREQTLGADHPDVAQTLNSLGTVAEAQGKYSEAEGLLKRALAIQEHARGANPVVAAQTINNLALVYERQGRYNEAEGNFKRAVAMEQQALGLNHPTVLQALQNLAVFYKSQGRFDEAEGLQRQVLTLREKALGERHPDVASTLNNLANVYQAQRRYAEAETLYRRALAIQEQALGPDDPAVSYTLHNIAVAAEAQGRKEEAQSLYKRALALRRRSLGEAHPELALTLSNLANVYASQRKYDAADDLYQQALAIYEQTLGAAHPSYALALANRASLESARGNVKAALEMSRKATASILEHRKSFAAGYRQAQSDAGPTAPRLPFFPQHVATLAGAARAKLEPPEVLGREAFEISQWANQSSAALALQQMAARFASGTGALTSLVREHQDLLALAREKDKELIAALSQAQPNRAAMERLRAQIADVEARTAAAAVRLEREFPDYAALANPKPLRVEELLARDEALVFWLLGESESYVFAVTADKFDWRTIALGSEALSEKVAILRRGVDIEEVRKSAQAGKPALLDLGVAHVLFMDLLSPVDGLIKDKPHLLVVPSGPLTSLPLHLIVTEPAKPVLELKDIAAYREAAWLLKREAVSVLPSVASLKALRSVASRQKAPKPLVGFGDPVFDPAERARALTEQRGASGTHSRAATRTRGYSEFWRGASLNRAALARSLPSLIDTADELKAVAAKVGANSADVHLENDASETTVKRAPLADHRIVYFATHGLVAGEIEGLAEPSLALTLPRQPSELDDGLLTASEVAQLKLNADWVVLSACNTAAGEKPGAEALSGLARAFFYAGARALLVSHWSVDSEAATRLTTTTFELIKSDASIGRAEALRRAMLAYMNDPANAENAYPAFWAPFEVVGEGIAR